MLIGIGTLILIGFFVDIFASGFKTIDLLLLLSSSIFVFLGLNAISIFRQIKIKSLFLGFGIVIFGVAIFLLLKN